MTELEQYTGLLDVRTGELLPATVPNAARAISSARALKHQINEIVHEATSYLVEVAALRGTKTLHEDGETVEIKGGTGTEYDAQDLVEALELAGCPQDRIDAAVIAQISYKIDRSVLRQLAGANPDYKAAIELAERQVDRPYSVTVKLRRTTDE